jgi:hypothetical protein
MSENGNQSQTSTQDEHVVDCVRAVEDYRGQQINKWEVIMQISTAIHFATASVNDEQRTTTG